MIKKNEICLYGIKIRENKELDLFSLSDLIEAYNYARIEHKWSKKNISASMKAAKFVAFIEKEFKLVLDKKNISKNLKDNKLVKTIGARDTRNVFVNKKIWDYIYNEFFIRNFNKDKREYRHFDKYANLISNIFKGVLPYEFEKKVLSYRVDIYFESLNLCVEYDENHHSKKLSIKEDLERESIIKNESGCKFLRVKIGDEIDSINTILKINKADNIYTTSSIFFSGNE